ncbi:EAL domain-containing protein (putative c-di-GMP-specific phosphodiesterase class I) [Devosia subaequoris]|uniref:EAL domain-containing protein (Putative c-di-GMP-specific phosphodiesterase class I) n=1 Tax=Devosia subaequoris TaxID=395930 RepID=A0A7W6IIQ9_9HYPH|nr:EAL domain-containing protein [Devosia subaequoris]MBB4050386.1 EAL domain-containing protein (putative c-di-GMP-specific phosphodiesterase class I) [Devosia subaequoris]
MDPKRLIFRLVPKTDEECWELRDEIEDSIIGAGKTLGLKVVAEGVETKAHADLLRRLGRYYLQGYAFARPMSAESLQSWLRERDSQGN